LNAEGNDRIVAKAAIVPLFAIVVFQRQPQEGLAFAGVPVSAILVVQRQPQAAVLLLLFCAAAACCCLLLLLSLKQLWG
jgi:hypothetical protein